MHVTSRGHRIHYATAGDGERPALLLVHGILQSGTRWAEMGYLDAFADTHRVIAVDLLGHGSSDRPTDPDAYTVDAQLQDLLAVLDEEGAATCHVWGYSGGAVLAFALAATHPERILSTIAGGIPPNLPRDARAAVFGPWIDALQAGDWDRFWQAFLPVDAPTRALLQAGNDHRAVAAWLRAAVDTADLVAPGEVPTLVYMGDEELFLEDARQTADIIDARFEVIPGRGHAGAFQDLAVVGPIVRSFLGDVPRATAARQRQGDREMHALFVNFSVPEKSPDEVVGLFEPLVPSFANLPGNLAKIWLADSAAGRYGALYLWRTSEDMDAYLDSELWHAVQDHPAFTDFDVRDFAVIEPFTKATQPMLSIV